MSTPHPGRRPRPRAPIDFIAVSPGSEELLGMPASWAGVADRLRTYSLPELLDLLGRMSILLEKGDGVDSPAKQAELLTGLFGPKPRVAKNLQRLKRESARAGQPNVVVVFSPWQVANAVKAALIAVEPDHRATEPDRPDHRRLGQALLMINSLITQVSLTAAPGTPGEYPALELMTLANGTFFAGGAGIQDFARASELYMRDRERLKSLAIHRDLAADLRRVSGLDPEMLWAVYFALYAHLAVRDAGDLSLLGARVEDDVFMKNNPRLPADVAAAFFSLVSQDITELREQVVERYGWADMKPYDFVPLARRPLVRIGHEHFPLGLRFLEEKLTTGLHHLFLDPSAGLSEKERKEYLGFMGYVWEDYVRESLERAYPAGGAVQLLGEDAIKPRVAGKSADAVLVAGDLVVVIESKATLFTLAARSGESWKEYTAKLEDLVFDAAAQLDNTVRAVEAGMFSDMGVVPSAVRRFVPILASLEKSAMNPFLFSRVEEQLKAKGYLQGPRTTRLQILDPSEVELVEMGAQLGSPLHGLLEAKADDVNLGRVSFRNFLFSIDHPVLDGKHIYLAARFDALVQLAVDLLGTSSTVAN